jgi:transcriptional regulator with XRE-family HTH domain
VGQRPGVQTRIETRLAAWRVRRGITQAELAAATGLSLATYRRLERGMANPPVRYLANCALALGCPLEDLLEDEHRTWLIMDLRAATPPAPEGFWRSG